MPKLSAEKCRAGRHICNICGNGAAISTRNSFEPGGDNQIAPRSAIVRSTTPPIKRVTRELLGQIATQTSVSAFVLLVIIPRLWARSSAESPAQPKSTEDAISPSVPYFSNPCSRTPIDSSPMLSTIYPFRAANDTGSETAFPCCRGVRTLHAVSPDFPTEILQNQCHSRGVTALLLLGWLNSFAFSHMPLQ